MAGFDTATEDFYQKFDLINEHEWVISAISVGKPLIHKDNAFEVERAIWVNALLPHLIARQAKVSRSRVIQPGTNLVFSGKCGPYCESDIHDATDIYGKTRSLGEVPDPAVICLRCDLIGPEPQSCRYILQQLLDKTSGAEVNGLTNSDWNGLTTMHFAKLCQAIIKGRVDVKQNLHLTPGDAVSHHHLLQLIMQAYHLDHLKLSAVENEQAKSPTLKSNDTDLSSQLWAAAGYVQPPTISQMLAEITAFDFRLANIGE